MQGIDDADFETVRELVFRESAIVIDADMKYLVESRLTSLIRKSEFSTIGELVASLRKRRDPDLPVRVVEAMTTNETSFFRDGHPFETLCREVLPALASTHTDTLRIWCAACSTGQEAYTIAMAVHEHCPELASRISILGTDLSAEVVAKAEAGRYSRLEVNRGLPVQFLTRYFVQQGLSWEVTPRLRELVSFDRLNLIGDWHSLPRMDVIFLRNVLIYFDTDIKTQILRKAGKVLKPGGCLFLGLSETTLNLQTDYERVKTEKSHFFRIA
ncbi:MAG: protein-glutamate O-methyltransferase CheR [Granulosicoccus sp.]|nr:protein-glutamate O-methyltransferase CheR [Granulosicoccus sp.]